VLKSEKKANGLDRSEDFRPFSTNQPFFNFSLGEGLKRILSESIRVRLNGATQHYGYL
jgi:hypothetical protein